MPKSLYSLILSDDIVLAVDLLAAEMQQSRSSLINHILAQHLNLSTPEQRQQDIFNVIGGYSSIKNMHSDVSPGGILTLRSLLHFKYNPTLCYVVQLEETDHSLGMLKVGARTQSKQLLGYLNLFFNCWNKLEQTYLPKPPPPQPQTFDGWIFRSLRGEKLQSKNDIGYAVASYISRMDGCIKIFFSQLDDPSKAAAAMETFFINTMGEPAVTTGL